MNHVKTTIFIITNKSFSFHLLYFGGSFGLLVGLAEEINSLNELWNCQELNNFTCTLWCQISLCPRPKYFLRTYFELIVTAEHAL